MQMSTLSMSIPDIKPGVVFTIGDFEVTQTMVSAVIVIAALIIFAAVVRIFFIPRWQKTFDKKSGFRLFLEAMVGMFEGSADSTVGSYGKKFVGPWYFGAAALICLGTLIELFALRPPTSDLSFALAMGFSTFIIIHIYGFRKKKVKRLLHYLNPMSLISDVVLPFSLALRMFGSVFSGFLIMHLIYSLPFPIAYPALGNVMFTIFHALIQSYIFMFLSMSFIAEAIE